MDIQILYMLPGARQARGIAVIIDVFRAFSFECYAVENHVAKIIPVADKELAYALKRENPSYVLAGERNGRTLEGFDYGNSPSQIQHVDLTGKTLIHTTSAGTQGLENALNADEILTGSLVNAKAIARYIRLQAPAVVSLVCMGTNAIERAEEDDLCAEYIRSLLLDEPFDLPARIEALRHGGGAKFFDPTQSDVFPRADYALCTAADRFPFVLRAERDDGLLSIVSIPVNCSP